MMTLYQEFIHKTRYAKWKEEEGRREHWDETVDRVMDYYEIRTLPLLEERDIDLFKDQMSKTREAVVDMKVMPSMRSMMAAGPAMDRTDVAAYNCAYLPVDDPRSFDEAMYILMCGTGVGFSVEEENTHKLPKVSHSRTNSSTTIVVEDSKEGWASSFRELISLLYAGIVPKWDLSKIRPEGARLKTFGGRASGPDPLDELFRFTVNIFENARGRRLTTLECHDLMCKIAKVVVVGGVRRSAMISLSDLTDERMREAKTGAWWEITGHRALANNSAVYENRRPDMQVFMKEWKGLYDSRSGERGIFSRYACQNIAKRNGRRHDVAFGTNPCSEIILRPFQFCNLTEIIVRAEDTFNTLEEKAKHASFLGTIQSTFTNFDYLRPIWRENCEEERLLGVSMTGVCDNLEVLTDENLEALKDTVLYVNQFWATKFGIPASAATTCNKPSGTVSQLVGAGKGGIHAQHSDFWIRSVRADNKDPITQFFKDKGVYNEPDVMSPDSNTVFFFAQKAPEGALKRDDQTAIDSLELWKKFQDHWCEHKPSVTVDVREPEWMEVGAWVYENFDSISGISFLPHDGGTYKQAPFQAVTEEEYEEFLAKHPMPDIDWEDLKAYETDDMTTSSQELACSGSDGRMI